MSDELPDFQIARIREWIGEGWQDDEILDGFDRYWDRMGSLRGGPGPRESPHAGRLPLRVRRMVAVELAAQRQASLATAPPGPTAYALEMIPRIAQHFHAMTRPSKRGAAQLAGINRETLDGWIERGWITWPPPKPAPSDT